jgi:predicted TIM-barrel fold metal-dependent hydrolase
MQPQDQTYVGGQHIHDSDAHIMEPGDWLIRHAASEFKSHMPALDLGRLHGEAQAAIERHDQQRHHPELGGDDLIRQKNWAALGAFNAEDRSHALDRLGFRSQLIFPTYAHHVLISLPDHRPAPPDLLYAMVDAHNRGIAAFCADDPRLLAVGFIALDVPERAIASAKLALDLGCAGLEMPTYPVGPLSLTHPVYDPLYRMLEERRRPLLLHVGGGGKLVNPVFGHNSMDGRPDEHAGLTYIGIPAPLELAVSALILDGVFERFPNLMCGVIEQGAAWLPGFVRRLDAAFEQFSRPHQRRRLSMRPSEYVFRQVRVTPFPFEDMSWIIEQTGANILMFGSDYPHDEGGEDPLASFDLALQRHDASAREAVLCSNYEQLLGDGLPAVLRSSPDTRQGGDDARRRTGASPSIRQQALLRLFARNIAAHNAIQVTREELQDAVDEFRLEYGLDDIDRMLRWMEMSGLSEDTLVQILEEELLSGKLIRWLGERLASATTDQIVFVEACRRARAVAEK